MRLLNYRHDDQLRHGRLDGDEVVELGSGDLTLRIAEYSDSIPRGGRRVPIVDVEILAPLLTPPKVLAAAANYQDHVREGGGEPLDKSRLVPRLFLKPTTSITGPGADVAIPDLTQQLDWEAELAVVIGRGGKDIAGDDALTHVFGYTCANDISARSMDYGFERDASDAVDYFDWLAGKWGDAFAPIGPWISTADEVGDPQRLQITFDLNGDRYQDGSSADMIFTVAELVAHASRLCTLLPGDILLTGTPSGVGLASGRLLRPGDRMTVAISGIGELTNQVV
ncbi:fumarylacetoacetate hydrolase family protein [Microlunatus soli]|uniref:2-keto-4-pentenoate hydratase/2-oxohepta-3-ene-1,7-dioic acid hydratase (Catechol pathway) n=1 Tax=Microlunatus soli TaxID=630515 RepID=A0A1H1R1S3_9ACTN|nr:fumarylacetoacetate hydrolase family protein [Microlunatus soli]SDS29622.1 2-keto-4-pentenoate hydratase/2-oxohepta-3-ene-1,7-dioic acid hydratase (catechol pathway) [Microlunatus soli]